MRSLFLLLFVFIAFSSCHFRSSGMVGDVASFDSTGIEREEKNKQLPPLNGGELFLKDKDPFDRIIELKGEQLFPDTSIYLLREPGMVTKNDLMVIKTIDFTAGAHPFLVFEYPEMKLINRVGVTGKGPGEFSFPDLIPASEESLLAYLFETTNDKLYALDFSGNIFPSTFEFDSSQNSRFSQKSDIYAIGKDRFMYVDHSSGGKSIFLSCKEDDLYKTEEIISLQLDPRRTSPFTYTGHFAIHPERDRMVYAYQYFKVLKFMNTDGEVVRTLNYQQTGFDDKTLTLVDGLDHNLVYYWWVCVQPDHVYYGISGITPIEASVQFRKGERYTYIEQYDWNGNPVAKYKLDQSGRFYVDEKRKEIVLISPYHDEPFFRFSLP